MAKRFCTNCGAQLVEGTAFCTSCGAPAAAGAPAQPGVPPPPAEAPPPPPSEVQPPVAASPPVTGPLPPRESVATKRTGISRPALIAIVILGVLAVVIASIFVQRSEREFQRKRRAGQTSLSTSGPPTRPVAAGSYGSVDSRGAAGSDEWVRNQIVGRWTETRDCSNPVQFRADGTTLSGRWTFRGGRLSLIESDWSTVVEVVSIGTREMVLANTTTRRRMTWRRC